MDERNLLKQQVEDLQTALTVANKEFMKLHNEVMKLGLGPVAKKETYFEYTQSQIEIRNDIIASRILGWKKYKVNSQQEAYAPNLEAARAIPLGKKLSYLVEKAIDEMRYE